MDDGKPVADGFERCWAARGRFRRILVPYHLTLDIFCMDFGSSESGDDDGLGHAAERCGGGTANAGQVVAIGSGNALDYAEVAEPAKLA